MKHDCLIRRHLIMCLTSLFGLLLSQALSLWQLTDSLIKVASDAALCASKMCHKQLGGVCR